MKRSVCIDRIANLIQFVDHCGFGSCVLLLKNVVQSKVFPGSHNLASDSCVAITTQESEARLREPGKTLVQSLFPR